MLAIWTEILRNLGHHQWSPVELKSFICKYVPTNCITTRSNQSWFNTQTTQACTNKARAHKKAHQTNSERNWTRVIHLKTSSKEYADRPMISMFQISSATIMEATRILCALLKSKRCDQLGVSHLKWICILYMLHSDPKMKSNFMSNQFTSLFTKEELSSLPNMGISITGTMSSIFVLVLESLNP